MNLFAKSSDGTGDVERVTDSPSLHHALAISPDKTLVFEEQQIADGRWDLVILELEGDHEPKPLLDSPFSERAAALTADGHWLVYQSDEWGRDEIYVRPFPDVASGKWQISTNGGAWPVWARDGRELFYLSEDGLMAVSIETEPFRRGPSQPVFETTAYVVDNQFYRPYDVSIDAKRFLMMKSTSSDDRSGPTQIHVILNWFEELERLVPTQ